ncbi:MAG: ATP-dependent Clp protease adaptor ClpS [Tepidisphaeraceae bacterium]
MAEQEKNSTETAPASADSSGTAVAKPKAKTKHKPAAVKQPPTQLPMWKVLLHNDERNDMVFVVMTIVELTPLSQHDAKERMLEAHKNGVALLLTTHKELAELYKDQFHSKGLSVTIEPER